MTAQKSKFYNRLLQFLKVSLAKGSPSLSLSLVLITTYLTCSLEALASL